MLDEIEAEKNRRLQKAAKNSDAPVAYDIGLSLTLQAMIDTVDGEKLTPTKKEKFVDDLLCYDVKFLQAKAEAINGKIGLDTQLVVKCEQCGYDIVTSFRLEPEFFNPVIR